MAGSCLGTVKMRVPFDMTMCSPWRAIANPAFCSARAASRWLTPEIAREDVDCGVDLADLFAVKLLFDDGKVLASGILDVLDRLGVSGALRPAPGKPGTETE